jgi:hypothetical protein
VELNNDIIVASDNEIKQEATEDEGLRQKYGATFNRPPSAEVNMSYVNSIQEYRGKLGQAA